MRAKSSIRTKDDPVLREVAKPVPLEDIKGKKIQDIISDMSKAMHGEDDSVAIAAPQIGVSLRIFLVNTETLRSIERESSKEYKDDTEDREPLEDLVFINPVIKKLSRKKAWVEEGCLSVRWLYGKVERSEKAAVAAYGKDGKKFEMGASGLLAQVFQHEIDHLDGILFIDKAKDLEDLPPNGERKL